MDVGDTSTPEDTSDTRDTGGEPCEPSFPSADEVSGEHQTLVAAQVVEPVAIDGSLDEAIYAQAPMAEYTDSAGDSDNTVAVRVLWDAANLYFAFHVTDADIDTDRSLSIGSRDGVEVILDVDSDRGSNTSDDHHWLIAADGDIHTELYTATSDEPETDLGEEVGAATVDGGYIVEIRVPADAIDLVPSDGVRMAGFLVNNDLDDGTRHYFTWPDGIEWKNPSTYGEIFLAADGCESQPNGDAGPDADYDGGGDAEQDIGPDTAQNPHECDSSSDFEELDVAGPAVIGGGPEYADKVCQDQADVVVSTRTELENALSNASSGDVVFVDPDARIDMGFDAELLVPSGVTLSGGRGCGCRAGALLYTDDIVKDDYDNEEMIHAASDSRVTGLRFRGPFPKHDWLRMSEMDHYIDGEAVNVSGPDVEVDNNEIWGFGNAAIGAGTRSHIHHNKLHNMLREGLGYGVNGGNHVLIEYNYFDWLRHAVANGGSRSYEARYNYMGTHAISHIFDMHRDGGGTVLIHHNTVESVDNDIKNKNTPGVVIRGVPSDTADIHHNWFYNPKEPRSQPTNSWTDEAIVQMHVTSWTNVSFWDNQYGSSDPGDCNIGAPREGCPLP